MRVVIFYSHLLAYFYVALYAVFLLSIIADKHWFKSMTAYNAYIKQLLRERANFLAELQDLKFILEVAEINIQLWYNFANDVKQRGNWKQADYPEKDLDCLSSPLYITNIS